MDETFVHKYFKLIEDYLKNINQEELLLIKPSDITFIQSGMIKTDYTSEVNLLMKVITLQAK